MAARPSPKLRKKEKDVANNKKYEELVQQLPALVGGKENIKLFTHCITRLRFNLIDKSKADLDAIKKVAGVMGVQWSGEQLQVIIGQSVGDAYEMLAESLGFEKQEAVDEDLGDGEKKKISVGSILDAIAGCLTPLIPAMIGSGMLQVLNLLLLQFGIVTAESPTYVTLSFMGNACFYFFPVLIGATAARKFGANMGIGMALGAMLLHPTFTGLVAEGTGGSIFGLPIYAGTYSSTVFPMILTMAVAAPVEKFFAKHSPDAVRSIVEPLCTLLVMAPVMLCVLAPIGSYLGDYLALGIQWLYNTLGFVGLAVLAALYPLLVMTGMHTALTPYMLASFASLGFEPVVIPANFISNFNQGAACAAVAVKAKDANTKSNALTCAITAVIGGVTEPAMFGITIPMKTPLYAAMAGNLAGGIIAGLMKVYLYAFPGSGGVFGLPCFIGGDTGIMNLVWLLVALVVGMAVTFGLTMVLYKPEAVEE